MKTIEEQIEIMTAYKNGAEIEEHYKMLEWISVDVPDWNWQYND